MSLTSERPSETITTYLWHTSAGDVRLSWSNDTPVCLSVIGGDGRAGLLRDHPVVDVFTAVEQRARTSQSYVRSAVGQRLRFVSVTVSTLEDTLSTAAGSRLTLVQHDERSGVRVETIVSAPACARALRFEHVVSNETQADMVLTAVTTAVVGVAHAEHQLDGMTVAWGDSEWLAEGRWQERPLRDLVPRQNLGLHGQDGRGRFALTSHGAWSTGEHIPVGVLTDEASGSSVGWQIESASGWQWQIGQSLEGAFLSLIGPADLEHHFARILRPGESFRSVPGAVVLAEGGRDAAVAELTRYRRWLRAPREAEKDLPIVYNDFMNTLMGDPSTEKLVPLIESAAAAGAEYFCIDAGWFAGGGDWWDSVGEWREDPDRFTGGLRRVIDLIHRRGMRSGIWLEPEVVGENSTMARLLPEDAFFHRFGSRVKEHGRYHLDFRSPAARDFIDGVADRLIADFGVSYFKLDYNINPGSGTDDDALGSGDGLLGHTRAFVDWLKDLQSRHAGILIENCSSGAMRMDYAYLAHSHLQSTSDQQDFLLYAPIAAAAPMTIVPEQCGNWAYPAADMTDEETVFTLVNGLSGRLYLSGFLDGLRPGQFDLTTEAVELSKVWRDRIALSFPRWPLGLPGWNDDTLALELDCGSESLLFVWWRGAEAGVLELAGEGDLKRLFPTAESTGRSWSWSFAPGLTEIFMPAGPSARVFRRSSSV